MSVGFVSLEVSPRDTFFIWGSKLKYLGTPDFKLLDLRVSVTNADHYNGFLCSLWEREKTTIHGTYTGTVKVLGTHYLTQRAIILDYGLTLSDTQFKISVIDILILTK